MRTVAEIVLETQKLAQDFKDLNRKAERLLKDAKALGRSLALPVGEGAGT